MLVDLLTVAVLAFFGARLVTAAVAAARSPGLRSETAGIVQSLRARHFVRAPFVLAAVATVAAGLVQVPGLAFGWWTALGGEGNVLFGVRGGEEAPELWTRLVPAAFVLLLVPLLPLFAQQEERLFRVGAESWPPVKRARRALEFGLVHLVMGIPVGVALALSVGGLYFTWAYLAGYRGGGAQAALREATCSHLAYNLVVVAVVASVLVAA